MTRRISHIRVITLSVKPDRMDQLQSRLGAVGERLAAVSGLQSWTAAVDRASAALVAIAGYDSEGSADAAGPVHREILGDFEEFFSSPPQIGVYEVVGSLAPA